MRLKLLELLSVTGLAALQEQVTSLQSAVGTLGPAWFVFIMQVLIQVVSI